MERLCFTLTVAEGVEDEYDRRHVEIWPEMADAMRAAGYANCTHFRFGRQVIGYAECHPNVESAGAAMAALDVRQRWTESMIGLVQDVGGPTGGLQLFAEVWHLD